MITWGNKALRILPGESKTLVVQTRKQLTIEHAKYDCLLTQTRLTVYGNQSGLQKFSQVIVHFVQPGNYRVACRNFTRIERSWNENSLVFDSIFTLRPLPWRKG